MSENNRKDILNIYFFRRWRGFSEYEACELRDGNPITLWARGMPGGAERIETVAFAVLAVATKARLPFRVYFTVPPNVEDGHRNIPYPLTKEEIATARAIFKANRRYQRLRSNHVKKPPS